MEIERHSRERKIELGQSLLGRAKIYLDACFWIMLRDTELEVRNGSDERKLLHYLRRGVRDKRLICPISASVFMELMKQPFTETRRQATAGLIDELSLGVSMIPPPELMETEIRSFLLSDLRSFLLSAQAHETIGVGKTVSALRSFLLSAQGGESLYPMQELIWTKVCNVLGEFYPSIATLPPAEELKLRKALFDDLWEYPLEDIIDTIGDATVPGDHFQSLSKATNEQNFLHCDELKSFEDTYDTELRGIIELAGETAADIIAYPAEKEAGHTLSPTPAERATTVNKFQNLLYFAMKKQENRRALRTLHIGASIHASTRWDKQRKYKPNDYYDFEHATAALSYCDAFFTETPLHILVTRPQIELEQVNNCRVISDLAEATTFIREVVTKSP